VGGEREVEGGERDDEVDAMCVLRYLWERTPTVWIEIIDECVEENDSKKS